MNHQVNQIGTVTESIEAVKMSKKAGWGVMASHRRYDMLLYLAFLICVCSIVFYIVLFVQCSGETEDTFIADLSVGLATVSAHSKSMLQTCYLSVGSRTCFMGLFSRISGL